MELPLPIKGVRASCDNHSPLGHQPHVETTTLRTRGLFDRSMQGILVSHLNVRSALPKLDELQLMLENGQGLVFGLSETWLSDKLQTLKLVFLVFMCSVGTEIEEVME